MIETVILVDYLQKPKFTCMNAIYFLKALHVVGFVSWFAGMFYLVRLFVYHVEADLRSETERAILQTEYGKMEQRVYKIIMNPAMMITWTAGLGMLLVDITGWEPRGYLTTGSPGWMHLKLTLLVLLTGYHLYCKRLMRRVEAGERPLSAWQLRLFNEVPTLFLATITFTAVYGKAGTLNYAYLGLGIGLFALLVFRSVSIWEPYFCGWPLRIKIRSSSKAKWRPLDSPFLTDSCNKGK